jgi:hypothetical protein
MEFKSYAQLIKKVEHSSCLDWAQGAVSRPLHASRDGVGAPAHSAGAFGVNSADLG